MNDPFTIAVERHRKFLRFQYRGFWTLENLDAYERACAALTPSLGWCDGSHVVLSELSDFKIQSKDVFDALSAQIVNDPVPPRRLALVCTRSLASLQFRRVMVRDSIRMFETAVEAECWLFEPAAKPLVGRPSPVSVPGSAGFRYAVSSASNP